MGEIHSRSAALRQADFYVALLTDGVTAVLATHATIAHLTCRPPSLHSQRGWQTGGWQTDKPRERL